MNVYKISLKNKELQDKLPAKTFYFEDQETAEAVIETINSLLKEGITFDWECEVIDILSHEETIQQFLLIDDLFKANNN